METACFGCPKFISHLTAIHRDQVYRAFFMELSPFLFMASKWLILSLAMCYAHPATSKPHNNFTDLETLLAFKAHVIDPRNILSANWTTNTSFCSWTGISCSPRNQRVSALSLPSLSLQGTVPPFLANLSFLTELDLTENFLTGTIPESLSLLPRLTNLNLAKNNLSGTIPSSLGNLTKLNILNLSWNNLTGTISEELGSLINLRYLHIGINQLNGSFPTAFLNASKLYFFDFSLNYIRGQIPEDVGMHLPKLQHLHFHLNFLTGGLNFIDSLSNCNDLQYLLVRQNSLEGALPESLGNLSKQLQYVDIGINSVLGRIPKQIGNISGLIYLDLGWNNLTGKIPPQLATAKQLQYMALHLNVLNGSIPHELGQLRSLNYFGLQGNELSGPIPSTLANITRLQHLLLPGNRLSSSIPSSVWTLAGLIRLLLNENELDGSLPREIGNMKALIRFDLSKNRFAGNIPDAFGELQSIQYLDFSDNLFSGQIPQSVGRIASIQFLNLSYNSLSGTIPDTLANLSYLINLDLSYNKLEGEIPEGKVFSNASIPILKGNEGLCGASQLQFPPCPPKVVTHSSKRSLLKYILPSIAFGLASVTCFCLFLVFKFCCKRKQDPSAQSGTLDINNLRLISYHELVRSTDNFCEANLLGTGGFGTVFKASLDDGLLTAVKVLNLEVSEALKSFEVECQILSSVRHRNLVKIISACSNLEFKALILDFMPNGSLEKWLYSHNYCLDLLQRINIIIDVSLALEYLHHHHSHVVVHCDLKPSNVLLDANMVGHVGDFGIAKLLHDDNKSMSWTKTPGTIGYMAPEYASVGNVSKRGDIYSFGILLLETFTRKKPTDAMFDGETTLRKWASEAHPAALSSIVDNNLLINYPNTAQQSEDWTVVHGCLSSVIELGLLCSVDLPQERILMNEVVPRLQKIKMEYLSKLHDA